MTTQTYVTYISAVLANIQTVVWDLAVETKGLLGDSEAGRELLSITLTVFVAIYVASRFATYWQQAIAAQYYAPVYTKVLMQKVLALEEQQNKFTNDLSKLTTRAYIFDGSCRLKSLETRLGLLEGGHFLGVREAGEPFTFQGPFSNDTSIDRKKTKRSCRKRVRKTKHSHRPGVLSAARATKTEVRECCRNLYGDEWWNHPNKSQRMAAVKRKMEVARDDELPGEKSE